MFELLLFCLFSSSLAVVGMNFIILFPHSVHNCHFLKDEKAEVYWHSTCLIIWLNIFNWFCTKYIQNSRSLIKCTIFMGQEGWFKKKKFFESANISKSHFIIAKRRSLCCHVEVLCFIFVFSLTSFYCSATVYVHVCVQLSLLFSLVGYPNLFGYNYELHIYQNLFLVYIWSISFLI